MNSSKIRSINNVSARRLFHSTWALLLTGALAPSLLMTASRAEADAGRSNCKGHLPRDCPRDLRFRTPQETVEEHVALIAAGNIDAAMCDFAPEATVILPGQVVQGLDNIRGGLEGIGSLLGSGVPEVTSITAHDSVVLLTFQADGVPCTIPDGSDTYIVRRGKIVAQTVHDTFVSADGYDCPLAAPPQ
jgi:hypothetical protein